MSKFLKITAPANTPLASPVLSKRSFPLCVLTRATIVFPKGHAGLTGLWIEYQGNKVLPEDQDQVYAGNDVEIELYPNLPILEPPYEIEVHLYNLDDTNPHSCYLTFDILLDSQGGFPDSVSLAALNSYFLSD